MMKKLAFAALISANLVSALTLNYDMSNWKLDIPASTRSAGIVYLPMQIDYSTLENAVGTDNNLTIYTIATSSKFVESLIGVRILPKVIITKNSVKYELISYENGNKKEQYFNTFKDFNETVANMNIPNNKNWFIKEYIGYMDKIHKNGVYYIKSPKGFSFNIGFNLPQENDNFFPPQPPKGINP